MKLILNGLEIKENQLTLNRGMLYGECIFTSFAVIEGAASHLDKHIERLVQGANELYFFDQLSSSDTEFLRQKIFQYLRQAKIERGRVRLSVYFNKDQSFELENLQILIECTELELKTQVVAQSLPFVKSLSALSHLKISNYAERFYLLRKANISGFNEVIFYDDKGYWEASTSNIILIKNGNIQIASSPFMGITINVVLQFLKSENMTYSLLDHQDISAADEFCLLNAVQGIFKLTKLDDTNFNNTNSEIYDRIKFYLNSQFEK
jgi:branched-subunit amino acid aminotransferase/4-amino-4-deoxychorismate lyase